MNFSENLYLCFECGCILPLLRFMYEHWLSLVFSYVCFIFCYYNEVYTGTLHMYMIWSNCRGIAILQYHINYETIRDRILWDRSGINCMINFLSLYYHTYIFNSIYISTVNNANLQVDTFKYFLDTALFSFFL